MTKHEQEPTSKQHNLADYISSRAAYFAAFFVAASDAAIGFRDGALSLGEVLFVGIHATLAYGVIYFFTHHAAIEEIKKSDRES
jgi:hypothetical protein